MIWLLIAGIVWLIFFDRWYVPPEPTDNITRCITSVFRYLGGIYMFYCLLRGFNQMGWIP